MARNVVLPNGQPAQPAINLQIHPGPWANPISVAMPSASGLEVHVAGGLSKLEAAAIQLAAGMSGDDDDTIAVRAAIRAERVLRACAELTKKRIEEGQNASAT